MEQKHPHLKKLLVVFLVVFLVLVSLAGWKLYHDMLVPVDSKTTVMKGGDNRQDITAEEVQAQLEALDQHTDKSRLMSPEEVQAQLESLDKKAGQNPSVSAEEVQQQLEALGKK
jgi:multidrug efflux pump subunit AcrB